MAFLKKILLPNLMRSQVFVPIRFCAKMDDPLNHATGLEKRELLAIESGDPDPFNMGIMKRCEGTREKPNCIPSAYDKRIVGCICNDDVAHISYMWLHGDHMKRCACGYWFKLIYKAPV